MKRGRLTKPLELMEQERDELARIARQSKAGVAEGICARIVLGCAEGDDEQEGGEADGRERADGVHLDLPCQLPSRFGSLCMPCFSLPPFELKPKSISCWCQALTPRAPE